MEPTRILAFLSILKWLVARFYSPLNFNHFVSYFTILFPIFLTILNALQDVSEIFRVLFPDQDVLSSGAIFGIVAGVLLAVGIGVVVAICCSKKKVHGKCSTETAVVEVVVE